MQSGTGPKCLPAFGTVNPAKAGTQADAPSAASSGINTYSYVGGNPINAFDPLGLVDLLLTSELDRTTAGLSRIPHQPGVFSVGIHFNGKKFTGPDGDEMPVSQLADAIKNHPGYNGTDIVRLYSCRAGASIDGNAPVAAALRKLLPSDVQAADAWVFVGPTQGFLGLSTKTPDGGMAMPRSGKWVLFDNKGP